MTVNLTKEGKEVVAEAHRLFGKKVLAFATFFGVVNVGALFAIYLAVQSAAQATVSARMQEQIKSTVSFLEQVVSEALREIGEAREQVGAARSNLENIELRVASLSEALSKIDDEGRKVTAAAEILKALGTSGEIEDFLARITELEGTSPQISGCKSPRLAGGTSPKADTEWILENSAFNAIMTNVDTSVGNFTSTPSYFVSVGGKGSHRIVSANSIYIPSEKSFRLHLQSVQGLSGDQLFKIAEESSWYVNWFAVGC